MWIFCKLGFFSVVQVRGDVGKLLVRGRARPDLAFLASELREFTPNATKGTYRVKHTPEADYPFRLTVAKLIFARWLEDSAERIDYDNFKASVPHRAEAYHAVWAALRRAFPSGGSPELRPGGRLF